MARHRPASSKANGECSPQGGDGIRKLTYCKQDEVLLVVLTDTVIDPGTVVVHFPNAPLADAERAARQTLRGAPTEAGGSGGLRTHAPAPLIPRGPVFHCMCAGRAWKGQDSQGQSFQTGGQVATTKASYLVSEKKAGTDSTEKDTALLREEWAETLVYREDRRKRQFRKPDRMRWDRATPHFPQRPKTLRVGLMGLARVVTK